ncbi:TPA: type-F conjugative transfer system protein TrbI [Salmonella enterica]|uniref:Type-F conjugative transfer system protein TrbI n=1 Tax=Salmonella oranienberg TaxID=28147 RepID=A0A5W8FSR6_SALON|nr:type-F conjugative transfer system protein TrbI [Salmonella enterica subsp. enterica serovar Oranienburg]EBS1478513.1 type-F conjugative transfer system protein TrbI [Salmonella enterica subsp. enterica serovar Saintpaul]EBU7005568.1 type-F conjugative transfer system protein TrbI [Salmonella enterica subsp. enterica serovar Kintambo]ECH8659972.1 type-F conjugative transfer system protein TrbI [Salmonella enterica subsp. enterica serovar Nagoya]ECQ4629080.1 type-F conjugative transfer system
MDDEKLKALTADTPAATASNSPSPRRSRRRWRCVKPVALVAGGMTAINAAITLLLIQWQQPAPVSVDLTGTVNNFVSQAAEQRLDEAQMQALSTRFHSVLSASLTDWQQKHRTVILVAPAVVSGTRDITPEIQAEVARRMAEGD